MTQSEAYSELKRNYDGYHFTDETPGMYNPFSLLNALQKRTFGSYWFETGTPSYLVELMQDQDMKLWNITKKLVSSDVLNSVDIATTEPISVIFQSGYLTIKGYKNEYDGYLLGFPNEEVKRGFLRYLIPRYTSVRPSDTAFEIESFVEEVRGRDISVL